LLRRPSKQQRLKQKKAEKVLSDVEQKHLQQERSIAE
jgi:hypothetical protein